MAERSGTLTTNLDRLEALARAATPGERKAKRVHTRDEARYEFGVDKALWWVEAPGWVDADDYGLYFTEADAKLFAALDPQVVLDLISELRAVR